MKFLLIVGHDDDFGPTPELITKIVEWNDRMSREGILEDSNPLVPWQNAKTVRVRDGKTLVTPGSFTTSEDKIAAYVVIQCPSEKDAVRIAATHPMAAEAVIEVRPVWENIAG